MERRVFTVRDTQRGSQSYMEKRRGKREIAVTRRRSWGTLTSLSFHFLVCKRVIIAVPPSSCLIVLL